MQKLFLRIYLFIILSLVATIIVGEYGIEKVFRSLWEESVEKAEIEISRGLFYLVLRDLKNKTQPEMEGYFEGIQPHFGFPIFLSSLSDTALRQSQKEKLEGGRIVLDIDREMFFKRIDDSEKVIGIGPVKEYNFGLRIYMIYFGIIAFVLAVLSILWSFFSWKNINRLVLVAKRLSNKDFSVRVKVPKFSALRYLAENFNDMAQKIESLMQSHKDLTNSVSHELLTPVSRIRFDLENLDNEVETVAGKNALEGIRNDIDEIEDLVRELLSYAKYDRDGVSLNVSELDLLSWLPKLVKDFSKNYREFELAFNTEDYHGVDKVHWDIKLMDRALSNILRNAARFAKSKITVTLAQNDSLLILHIDDDGHGIPKEERGRVFDPFIRLDKSHNLDQGGHGLGLAIVKKIVDLHQGSIEIEDSPLGGARFTFKMRLSPSL